MASHVLPDKVRQVGLRYHHLGPGRANNILLLLQTNFGAHQFKSSTVPPTAFQKIHTRNDVSVMISDKQKLGIGVPYLHVPVPYLPVYWNTDFKMPTHENESTDPYR
jgi:hypothetical protein